VSFVDAPPLRAAVHGRVLLLEGVEKAERNVLPLLNNLLENREMALDDGGFLSGPDSASERSASADGASDVAGAAGTSDVAGAADGVACADGAGEGALRRASPSFVTIALGLPHPTYTTGSPLDPPLRSRFAAYWLPPEPPSELADAIVAAAPTLRAKQANALADVVHTLRMRTQSGRDALQRPDTDVDGSRRPHSESPPLPSVPAHVAIDAARTLERLPHLAPLAVFERGYPLSALRLSDEQRRALRKELEALLPPPTQGATTYVPSALRVDVASLAVSDATDGTVAGDAQHGGAAERRGCVLSLSAPGQRTASLHVRAGPSEPALAPAAFASVCSTLSESQRDVLSAMLQSHAVGRDVCLLSGRGGGKSHVTRAFAALLGYKPHIVFCHRE
jgi:hypothetical protein